MEVAKKQRNYAQEYQRRKAKAIRQGYTGYEQKRKVYEHVSEMVDNFMDRVDIDPDFNWNDLLDDDPLYWVWFRVSYGKASAA